MNFDTIKEVCVEYCEDMYALVSNYLKSNDNLELVEHLKQIENLEDKIRICDDINKLFDYKKILEQIMNRIEVIINA